MIIRWLGYTAPGFGFDSGGGAELSESGEFSLDVEHLDVEVHPVLRDHGLVDSLQQRPRERHCPADEHGGNRQPMKPDRGRLRGQTHWTAPDRTAAASTRLVRL